jgi:hypothetical protein
MMHDICSYDDADVWVNNGIITNLIQHPIEIEPPAERAEPVALPVMLTTKGTHESVD